MEHPLKEDCGSVINVGLRWRIEALSMYAGLCISRKLGEQSRQQYEQFLMKDTSEHNTTK